jgi:7-cyano-7-deazaguanine synthase
MKSCVLLSGGMDSIALSWWKRPDIAITIDYGQLAAEAEIEASTAIADALQIEHHVLRVDCRVLGSGDMAGSQADSIAPESDWWPFRNQLLVTLAGMKAISLGVSHLWLGTVNTDERHADGRVEFFDAMTRLMSIQEGGLVVEAPCIDYTTQELIAISSIPAELLAYAHSCHKASVACGRCRGCNKYFEVYEKLGHDLDKLG